MKTHILDINGKEKSIIEIPSFFYEIVREDIISKILEAKKKVQPYSPSLMAGKQASAKGKLVHRRHVWKSQYGRGMSRVPRKTMSKKGSQFNWVGAYAPQTRGGFRAHPPKIEARINTLKINKKELILALKSALSATANEKMVLKKYKTFEGKKIKKEFPLVVEDKIVGLKTKEILKSLKDILGEFYTVAIKKKTQRAGRGKIRGRRYKSNAGMLLVIGNKDKLKINAFDVIKVKDLSVTDLAKGGVGRLTVYTENAVKDLREKLGGRK
jgi:large subunit ribosomal protein L4e